MATTVSISGVFSMSRKSLPVRSVKFVQSRIAELGTWNGIRSFEKLSYTFWTNVLLHFKKLPF